MMYGREARIPADIVYGTPMRHPQTPSQYAANLRHSLEQAYLLARTAMDTAAQRQKLLYDKKVHGELYKVDNLVWLLNPVTPKGKSRKLHCPWSGPFRVVKKLSSVVYRIQDTCSRRKRQVVHFDRPKPCDPNVRIPQSSQPARNTSPASAPTCATSPSGTNLQLVDDDDTDTQPVDHSQVPGGPAPSSIDQPRRYPLRTSRRRPDRYLDGQE